MSNRRNLFVSYARSDADVVRRFVDALSVEVKARNLPVDVWRDEEALQPGIQWRSTILAAIENSIGLLLFVSVASMRSAWVRNELEAVMRSAGRLIVPIILQHVPDLPESIASLQWLDISKDIDDPWRLRAQAARLAEVIGTQLPSFTNKSPLSRGEAQELAEFAVNEIHEGTSAPPAESVEPPTSVFVVHGHDTSTRDVVCTALRRFGVESIVLSQALGQSQSLLQKFLAVSSKARFAVVLLTADDYGASLLQYNEPNVGDRALQFRARQNVILELGFFYGHLGWENVFVLTRRAPRVFPNFERPSDLDGAVFDEIDDAGFWKTTLASKLESVGFKLHLQGRGSGKSEA
jgi:predicted nucleotide-binding protein